MSVTNTMRDVYGPDTEAPLGSVISNWCSGIYASDDGPLGSLYCGGSGHGNRCDAILVQTLSQTAADCDWSIAFPQSPNPEYFTENNGAGDADGGIPEGATRSPTPPHNYDDMVYIPAVAFGNSRGAFCYTLLSSAGNQAVERLKSWFLNLDLSRAADYNNCWTKSSNIVPANTRSGSIGSSVFDPVGNCVWRLSSGFVSGAGNFIGKLQNLSSTRDWTSIALNTDGEVNTSLYMCGGYCPPHDCFVFYANGSSDKLMIWKPSADRLSGTFYSNVPQIGTSPSHVGLEWCPYPGIQKFYGMEVVVGTGYPSPVAKTLTPPGTLLTGGVPNAWTWGSETFVAQGGAGAIGNGSATNPRYNALRWVNPCRSFAWANTITGGTNFFRPAGT
jgi:hypothetical protein